MSDAPMDAWTAGARQLEVFLNEDRIGQLYERQDIWAFRYDAAWLARQAMPLCNSLPLQAGLQIDTPTRRPVFWFFENLLPEEHSLAAIARQLHLRPEQNFALLAQLGAESAGALTLLPPGQRPPAARMRELTAEQLARRLRDLPAGSLAEGAPKHMSLAGAQYKLAVIYDPANGTLYEPVGAQASTHILKPQHPHTYYSHSVHNEYFCMRLAAAVGLPTPDTWLHDAGGNTVYVVARFDRQRTGDALVTRRFALDACQLLGLPRRNKYEASTLENLRACIDQVEAPPIARRQVLTWLAFNLLIGNGDAHLKNLTFMRHGDALRLAPAYDLVSTAVYRIADAGERGDADGLAGDEMTLAIAGEKRFLQITRDHLREAARALGANRRAMDAILDELLAVIETRADVLIDEIGASPFADAGAMRTLRQIRHAVIARLATRLQR